MLLAMLQYEYIQVLSLYTYIDVDVNENYYDGAEEETETATETSEKIVIDTSEKDGEESVQTGSEPNSSGSVELTEPTLNASRDMIEKQSNMNDECVV